LLATAGCQLQHNTASTHSKHKRQQHHSKLQQPHRIVQSGSTLSANCQTPSSLLQFTRQCLRMTCFCEHCSVPIQCSVKGLPWWYQLLVALAGLLALGGLWLTFLADPGALRPAASQGVHVHCCNAAVCFLLALGSSFFCKATNEGGKTGALQPPECYLLLRAVAHYPGINLACAVCCLPLLLLLLLLLLYACIP
jgi:hypothetical protein